MYTCVFVCVGMGDTNPSLVQDGCEVDVREYQESRGYLDGATKSYMERMGELMATRLAISDTEGEYT